jgi:hypothetical protein
MAFSSLGVDVGWISDKLMRRSYGRAGTVARLCAQPAQATDFELLRIALSGQNGRKSVPRSAIRSTRRRREQNAQNATKRLLCV